MKKKDCLFCEIVRGQEPSVKVFEDKNFVTIKNKYPVAPVHLLVLDKKHREKKDAFVRGQYRGYWTGMMSAAAQTVKKFKLDKTGYKLVNNGAGYNHFEHEHLHILGGSREEPAGRT